MISVKYPGAVEVKDDKKGIDKRRDTNVEAPKKSFTGYLINTKDLILNHWKSLNIVRERVLISLPNGNEENAWVYWYNFPVEWKTKDQT